MNVEVVKNFDQELIQLLIQMEEDAFGDGGLNQWHLVPFIRHGRVYLAKEGQNVVGMAQYMRDWDKPNTAYLMGVSIDTEERGKGFGTILLRESLRLLENEGITEVELTVDPQNIAAIRVYEGKLGFIKAGMRVDEYGAGENRLVMLLSLRNS